MLLHQKKNHYLRIGLAITAVITAMALVGCFWTPYAPTAMSGSEKFAAPSLRHLFGTDNFGRDIFSRVMVGARTTFFISACTVTIGAAVGTLVGALTGYFGGLVDELLMRVNDAVTAFPSILLALVFISLLGFGTYNVNDFSYMIQEGDLIYYNCGELHEVVSNTDVEIGTYCFDMVFENPPAGGVSQKEAFNAIVDFLETIQ